MGLPEEEDDFDFNERFVKMKAEFDGQLKEEAKLNLKILENLASYGVNPAYVPIKLDSHMPISASVTSSNSSSTSATKSRRILGLFTSDLIKGCCGNFPSNQLPCFLKFFIRNIL